MSFEDAGVEILRKLEGGLMDAGKTIMRASLIECPISGPETYIPQIRTVGRGPGRELVYIGDDPAMVGDNGTLRRSSRVFKPVQDGDSITLLMGYGYGEEVNPAGRIAAEYAVPVHERSELHHMPPTKSHFLADPVFAFAGEYGDTLASAVKDPNDEPNTLRDISGSDLGA